MRPSAGGLSKALVMAAGLWAALAHAHKPSDSYLTLTARDAGVAELQWHVALRDLDGELLLDANDDGQLTWGEVRSRWPALQAWVRPHLQLSVAGQTCTDLTAPWPANPVPTPALTRHTDGRYAVFSWRVQCPLGAATNWSGVDVDYRLFALSDPTHRGVLRWRAQAGTSGADAWLGTVATPAPAPQPQGVAVLGANQASMRLSWPALPATTASPRGVAPATVRSTPAQAAAVSTAPEPRVAELPQVAATVWRMVGEGMHHIGQGTDHILFLVTLLLVAVWRRAPATDAGAARWLPQADARSVLAEVLRLVTAFTVAHSVTLGLATYGVVTPPSRWVESLIAASVLLAAIDNLWPVLRGPRWVVVFAFGLVHGFGFAGVMQDLGLDAQELAWPLLGFNIGVELGQLMLVALVLPLAFVLRRASFYRWGVVAPASAGMAALALVWLLERSLDRIILSGEGMGWLATIQAWLVTHPLPT